MVQLQSPPNKKRSKFSSPAPNQASHLPVTAPTKRKLSSRVPSISSVFRRWPRRSVTLVVIVILVALASVVIPRTVQSKSDNEFIQEQLGQINNRMDSVKQKTHEASETLPNTTQIDEYRTALLDSIAACEAMKSRAEKMGAKDKEKYKDAIVHMNDFCRDMTEVNDYANRVASATKQFIAFPSHSLSAQGSTQAKTDLTEIVGYTITDLDKLKFNPVQDPALNEMIIGLQNLEKAIKDGQATDALSQSASKTQSNLVNARVYYWDNTIKIDLLQIAVIRLQEEFKS